MSNNLTMTSATYDTSTQKYGSAALSGGWGLAAVPVIPSSGSFMVQGWGRTNDTSATTVMIGVMNSFWIGKIGTAPVAKYGSGGTEVPLSNGANISDGAWHHYRLEVSSTGGKFYLDGTLIDSSSTSATSAAVQYTGHPLEVAIFATDVIPPVSNPFKWVGSIDDVAVFNAVNGSSFTPAQVSVSAPGLISRYALDSNGDDTAVFLIAPNNSAIVYSPYNWLVTSGSAKSINPGAYFRVMYSGSLCIINFDTTNNSTPLSQVWVRVDLGSWNSHSIFSTLNVGGAANSNWGFHLVEVMVKSTTETQNRWSSPSNTAIVFTGLTLDIGATVMAPESASKNAIFIGDSITEGVRTVDDVSTDDTDRNDAMISWVDKVAQLLVMEYGNIGFGGQGFTSTASGNVPQVQSAYNLLWASQARTFSPQPDLVVINEGTNDGSSDITSNATALLNGILSACTSAKIIVLRPFNGTVQSAHWIAAIAACSNPGRVHFIDTAGFFNTTNSADGLHPYGFENVTHIAYELFAAINPLLSPSGTHASAF